MKITIISPYFPYPKRGDCYGIERYTENLAIHLKKIGNDVKIVTSYWNGGTRHDNFKGIPVLRIFDTKSLFGDLGRRFLLHYKTFGLNLFNWFNYRFYKDSDVILLNTFMPFSKFFKFKGIPVIPVFHHLQMNFPIIKIQKNLFKEHNNIITISNRSKKSLKKVYKVKDKNIKVIPDGINAKRFNPSNRSEQIREKYGNNILLYSGLMLPRKRVPVLLRAMPYVIKEILDVHLILTGKGGLLNGYKKLANNLGIQNNTTFLGFVEDNELLKYYASCDIYVFPSWREGFGQVILEAMASGTPVICADKPPMSEIVGNGGLTFKVDDPKDLAKKIIYLLNNRDELARLRENGLTRVKEYSWIQIAKVYSDSLRVMINHPKKRSQKPNNQVLFKKKIF